MTRIFYGAVQKGTKSRMMSSGRALEVRRLGVFSPGPVEVGELNAGEVGFVMAGIKEVAETQIGDTITTDERPASAPLPGFKPLKPMVSTAFNRRPRGRIRLCRAAWKRHGPTARRSAASRKTSQRP